MKSLFEKLSANIRNIFSMGKLKERDGGVIRIETAAGRTLEKEENHPYGFKARAKKGNVIVLCHGGNFDSFELLSVIDKEGGPDLNDDDVAVYTKSGGYIICREKGEIELFGKSLGGLIKVDELTTQLDKLTARVDGIINALKNSPTASQDGGATYKAAIVVALNLLVNKENFSNIASDKVFHGN